VSFGVVSPGRWGRKLLDAAAASSRLRFAGVFSRTSENAAEVAAKHGGKAYHSLDALLADPAIEAVLLPTPHFLHHDQTIQALAAGKHVFVEKPLATTIAQGEAMLKAAEDAQRVVAVGHQGRHTGGIRKVRAMLAAGDFGEVATVVITHGYPHFLFQQGRDWRQSANLIPGGQLDELAVHYFEVLQHLFGPVRQVTGFTQSPAPEAPPTTATVSLRFAAGLIASYTVYASSVGVSKMTIYGTKGALELNRMGQDPSFWQPVSDMATARLGGLPAERIEIEGPYLVTTALTAELEDFAAAIRESRKPQVGIPESLATLRISRAVMEASTTGRTVEL
jgi:predicted dehydrogenase